MCYYRPLLAYVTSVCVTRACYSGTLLARVTTRVRVTSRAFFAVTVTLRGGHQVAHAGGGAERAGGRLVRVQRRGQRRGELHVAEVRQRAARVVGRRDEGGGQLLVRRREYAGKMEEGRGHSQQC